MISMNRVTVPIADSEIAGNLHLYVTIRMGPANPVEYRNGVPCWRAEDRRTDHADAGSDVAEDGLRAAALGGFIHDHCDDLPENLPQFLHVIELGSNDGDAFVPAVKFGLADDRRGLGRSKGEQGWFWNEDDVAGRHKAHVCAWVSDGTIDYFGPFVRPDTPYDFKLHIDLDRQRLTAWVVGRGDDDWFLLAEDVALPEGISCIDRVRTSVFPDGPVINGPKVLPAPWPEGESLRPHPQAKTDRLVDPDSGFRCQSMRSAWRKPGKHVTVFREQGVHAGFPDVAWAGGQQLVCAWRKGSHTGGRGGLVYACSDDLGKTWSKATQLTDLAVNTVRVQRLADGPLLLSSDFLSEAHDPAAKIYDGILWTSTDGGKNWGTPFYRRGGSGAHDNSRILERSDGSWMTGGSIAGDPANCGHLQELILYRSTDRGETWRCWCRHNDFPPRVLCEPTILEPAPGRLVMYARELRSDAMPGAKGFSDDGGKTWRFQDLPFPITGRTCAGFLRDGRVMVTFRSGIGRAALWAWIGDLNDPTPPQPAGSHFNDRHSVGLKDGELHIDNDGRCGQFTKYNLRPADTEHSTIDLTFEVMVQANAGRAASVSIPFAGLLRLFPDHVEMAHAPSLRAEVEPGNFHTYRVVSRFGRMELLIDGQPAWDTDQGDGRLQELGWAKTSLYGLAFGNEELTRHDVFGYSGYAGSAKNTRPELYAACIGPEVTGCSLWKRFEAVNDDPDPKIGRRTMAWDAATGDFPDQYQLDHIIEVEATVNGHENGYSGWVQLEDGRVFVVNYTDDTAAACKANPGMFGVPWIRGTYLETNDQTGSDFTIKLHP